MLIAQLASYCFLLMFRNTWRKLIRGKISKPRQQLINLTYKAYLIYSWFSLFITTFIPDIKCRVKDEIIKGLFNYTMIKF